jgi:RNA polymerase sigma-70 factor (ECF subfamily)
MNELPDQLLVQQILQGETDCFEILCKRYYTSLQAIAYAVLMDHHLAEDAAQEALANACRNLSAVRNPEKVAFWLAGICRNVAKDMLRAQSRQKRLEDSEAFRVSDERDDSDNRIRQAITQLPISLRQVVLMRYFDDLSYQQMGKILGLSEQAINGRLRRAKKKMETFLMKNGFRSDVS